MRRNYVRETPGEMKTTVDTYHETLAELVVKNSNIVVIYPDFADNPVNTLLRKKHPERIYDLGVAEANVITMAAGMAASGKIVFTHFLAMFGVGRAYNQIRQNVAYDRFNVKIVLNYSGLLFAGVGASHQIIEDIAALRAIPNLVLVSPADPLETKRITEVAVQYKGPMAIRLSSPAVPLIYHNEYPFELGKAVAVMDGEDATLISTGIMLLDSIEAADLLAKEGISVRLLDMHTIKPLDEMAVISAAKETGAIVTVEDSSIIGGLGGAVAEVVVENCPVPVKRIGVRDRFGQSGDIAELKNEYEISAKHIAQAVREVIKKKKAGQ